MFQHYLIGITIQLHRIVCNWCKPLFCSGFYINVSELRENYAKLYRYFSKHYWITRQNSIELLRLFLKTLSDYRTKLYLQFTLQFLKTLSDYTTNLYRSILRYNFALQQKSMDLIYSKTLSTKLYRSNAFKFKCNFPRRNNWSISKCNPSATNLIDSKTQQFEIAIETFRITKSC